MDLPSWDWTEPGISEVAPGVHRIPLPLPNDVLRAVNVYALVDGEEVVLVDGGWALEESENLLAKCLDQIGFGLGHISRFLVTHAHQDHYTQAVAIRRRFGATVHLGVGEKETFPRPGIYPDGESYQWKVLREAGAHGLLSRLQAVPEDEVDWSVWEPPDTWIDDRTRISMRERVVSAIHTPGHTRGHLVFHDAASDLLFAGDHILPHITPSIGYEMVPARFPLKDYLDSLALVRAMPDAMLLPAHGWPTPSVHARVEDLLAHHEERLDASLEALERGAECAYRVAGELRWTRHRRKLPELDDFNQSLAVLETVAHLDVLAMRGQAMRIVEDGLVRYTAVR